MVGDTGEFSQLLGCHLRLYFVMTIGWFFIEGFAHIK